MKRIDILDPLRGIASAAVMWFHLAHASSYVEDGAWLDASGLHGDLGVQVFFVISGFILPYALYMRRYRLGDWPSFVANRVIRLDPPYLVTILGVLLLTWLSTFVPGWKGELDFQWMQLAAHVGYVNAILGYTWVVPVFWTLAIEFQFYLMLALIYPLLAHAQPRIRFATLAAICALALLFSHDGATSFKPYVFQHIFLFGLGISVFWAYRELVSRRTALVLIAGCAAGTAATLGVMEMAAGTVTALGILFVPHLKAGRALAYLGTISYSLYLIHLPIGDRVLGIMERLPMVPKPAGVLVAAAVSIVAADLLYRLVERPSQRIASSLRYRSAQRATESASKPEPAEAAAG